MPQLGLGFNIPRFNIIESYIGILDELGNYNNCVLGIANKRLSKNFKNEWALLKELTGGEERWFGFNKNGDIPWDEITSWRNGADVAIKTINNQANINYPAYQNSTSYMPKIVESNVSQENGAFYNGANSNMKVDDYAGIQITSQPLCFYSTFKSSTKTGRFLFSKGGDTGVSTVQYAIYKYSYMWTNIGGTYQTASINYNIDERTNFIAAWDNNTVYKQANYNETTNSLSGTITNRNNFYIGCWKNTVLELFFNGNIENLLIFSSNEYSNYSNFVNGGI